MESEGGAGLGVGGGMDECGGRGGGWGAVGCWRVG